MGFFQDLAHPSPSGRGEEHARHAGDGGRRAVPREIEGGEDIDLLVEGGQALRDPPVGIEEKQRFRAAAVLARRHQQGHPGPAAGEGYAGGVDEGSGEGQSVGSRGGVKDGRK